MARGLAHRHHAEAVAKARARSHLKQWGEQPDEKRIGRAAHAPHPCSGPCCGNPRRWFGEMTMQERRAPQMLDDRWR